MPPLALYHSNDHFQAITNPTLTIHTSATLATQLSLRQSPQPPSQHCTSTMARRLHHDTLLIDSTTNSPFTATHLPLRYTSTT
eukprot:3063824-Amphidinium_carterae.1